MCKALTTHGNGYVEVNCELIVTYFIFFFKSITLMHKTAFVHMYLSFIHQKYH